MNHTDLALFRFRVGFNCAQAVFSAFATDLGVEPDAALRIASAFGGGIGRTGQTCGAVTGALMALGLKYGATQADDKATKERTYALAREFLARFQACQGATLCRDLLGYDIGTPEGYQAIRDKGLFTSFCPKLVANAVEIVEQMIA
jgi:C_GCAxxG_C_C family probable redox protein